MRPETLQMQTTYEVNKGVKVCEYSRSRSFHDDLILQDQASGERSQDQWSSGIKNMMKTYTMCKQHKIQNQNIQQLKVSPWHEHYINIVGELNLFYRAQHLQWFTYLVRCSVLVVNL